MLIDGVRVNYGVLDQSIQDDNIVDNSSTQTDLSSANNTIDAYDHVKIAYLEKDYFSLDGNFIFAEENKSYNVGWESENLSDENGNIQAYIEYIFQNTHDSYGVQITFPEECIAENFTLSYYNEDVVVGTINVTNNKSVRYSNYDVRLSWNRIRIEFSKINPLQRARLWDIVFGINDTYDENMLISVSASRTTDLAGDYDDCGEFSFQFYNEGRFNIKNINDLPVGLQEGLQVVIYVKKRGSNNYVPFGKYYSDVTEVTENGKIITISGYDQLYELNDSTFKKGVVYPEGRSLGDWAEEVAKDAGIILGIDTVFYSIISTGYITEVPHREALRLIAEAGCGILVIDKNGNLYLQQHIPNKKGIISKDDIVENSYNLINDNKYLGVDIIKYTFSAASAEQELGYLEEVLLTEEPQEIEITYSTYPAVVSTVQVFTDTSTSAKISNIRIYSDRILFDISGNAGDTTFITVTGKPYNSATTNITRGSISKNIKKIENNYLITGDIADNVAEYQFSRVVNKYSYNAEIVTETEIDISDEIILNAENVARATEGSTVYVTKVGFDISYENQSETIEGVDE